jgi:hypothetical protein
VYTRSWFFQLADIAHRTAVPSARGRWYSFAE